MDQKLKMEYDRLRRKEKEDSVRRREMRVEYERELEKKRLQEEKAMEEKLKREKDEIENYKK